MPDEYPGGIYRLPIPLPDSPLGTVNVYAVSVPDGVCLVDCGWNTPAAYADLVAQLAEIGMAVAHIREILVTHIHPDHFGLAERLALESGAPVTMHRREAAYVGARYGDVHALLEEMEAWLRINGVPPVELAAMTAGSLRMLDRVGTRNPDRLLEGGERLQWGSHVFTVIWTPGHSAGLICLHDPRAAVLISSDHVLPRISPHVGLHAQSLGNPLDDFLSSLRNIRDSAVTTVLPGHGMPFHDLAGRVDELVAHHQDRLATMETLVEEAETTAYGVAGRLSWKGSRSGWDRLEPFQRRMALTETLAHLEYLHMRGRVAKRMHDQLVLYRSV